VVLRVSIFRVERSVGADFRLLPLNEGGGRGAVGWGDRLLLTWPFDVSFVAISVVALE
jgi:hypothetical protein